MKAKRQRDKPYLRRLGQMQMQHPEVKELLEELFDLQILTGTINSTIEQQGFVSRAELERCLCLPALVSLTGLDAGQVIRLAMMDPERQVEYFLACPALMRRVKDEQRRKMDECCRSAREFEAHLKTVTTNAGTILFEAPVHDDSPFVLRIGDLTLLLPRDIAEDEFEPVFSKSEERNGSWDFPVTLTYHEISKEVVNFSLDGPSCESKSKQK
jgi:hypothetical protein